MNMVSKKEHTKREKRNSMEAGMRKIDTTGFLKKLQDTAADIAGFALASLAATAIVLLIWIDRLKYGEKDGQGKIHR